MKKSQAITKIYGFTKEGVTRQTELLDVDYVIYCLLVEHWK